MSNPNHSLENVMEKPCPECGSDSWKHDISPKIMADSDSPEGPPYSIFETVSAFDAVTCQNCGFTKFFRRPGVAYNHK